MIVDRGSCVNVTNTRVVDKLIIHYLYTKPYKLLIKEKENNLNK